MFTYIYINTAKRKQKEILTLAITGLTCCQVLEVVWKCLRIRVSAEVTDETTMNPAIIALYIVGNIPGPCL